MSDTAHGSREGSQFGPYHLRRLLGSGGMGEVYEAEDTVRDRIVALKLMAPAFSNDPVFRARLQREARSAGRLYSPHVVAIHDYGEIDGQLYVDMRLVEGTDLGAMLRQGGPLIPARAVAIVRQIASALDAAHGAGIMHRDVKPANVLINRDDFACLVDFGIANATTDEKLTQLGDVVGTYAYMAPERLSGDEENVTYRADIYALACVLYECLTGSTPYRGAPGTVLAGHITQPIPRPSESRPAIPKTFDQVIAKGMAKSPDDRYATAGDLAKAAQQALTTSGPPSAPPTGQPPIPPAPPTGPPPRQTPAPYPTVQPGWQSAPQPARAVGYLATGAPTGGLQGSVPPAQSWPGAPGVGVSPWTQPQPAPVQRKSKRGLILGGAAAVVVVATVVAGGLIWANRSDEPTPMPPSPEAQPSDPRISVHDNGVLIGDPNAPTIIDIFDEPICPPCGNLITSSASDINRALMDDKIAVRYHLVDFLNNQSPSGDYSTRAIAASLCVADANDSEMYRNFYNGLFAPDFQPEESASRDRTDQELVKLAKSFGASSQVETCILSGENIGDADAKAAASKRAMDRLGAAGTPAVFEGTRSVDIDTAGWVDTLGR